MASGLHHHNTDFNSSRNNNSSLSNKNDSHTQQRACEDKVLVGASGVLGFGGWGLRGSSTPEAETRSSVEKPKLNDPWNPSQTGDPLHSEQTQLRGHPVRKVDTLHILG